MGRAYSHTPLLVSGVFQYTPTIAAPFGKLRTGRRYTALPRRWPRFQRDYGGTKGAGQALEERGKSRSDGTQGSALGAHDVVTRPPTGSKKKRNGPRRKGRGRLLRQALRRSSGQARKPRSRHFGWV